MNPWRGLKDLPREVWLLSAATLVNRAGTMVLPFLVLYLTRTLGITPAHAALSLTVYGIAALITMPIAGRLTHRRAHRGNQDVAISLRCPAVSFPPRAQFPDDSCHHIPIRHLERIRPPAKPLDDFRCRPPVAAQSSLRPQPASNKSGNERRPRDRRRPRADFISLAVFRGWRHFDSGRGRDRNGPLGFSSPETLPRSRLVRSGISRPRDRSRFRRPARRRPSRQGSARVPQSACSTSSRQ
jgi:hypothetical protein